MLTGRVKAASDSVASEMETLRALQAQLDGDPLLRLANYREQPATKQAALALGILLLIRSGTDAVTGAATGDAGNPQSLSFALANRLQLSRFCVQFQRSASRRWCSSDVPSRPSVLSFFSDLFRESQPGPVIPREGAFT